MDIQRVYTARRHFGVEVFILAFIVSTVLTWLLGLSELKYQQQSLIGFETPFPGDLNQWQRAGDWSNIVFDDEKITINRLTDNRSLAKRLFQLPQPLQHAEVKLRVQGAVKTETYIENSQDDKGAALMIWIQDDKEEVLKYYTVMNLTGERDTYAGERIVRLPETAAAVILVLNSRDTSSSFSLLDAKIETVTTTHAYYGFIACLLLLWMALAFFAGRWLLRNLSTKLALLAGSLITMIVAGVLLPDHLTTPFVDPLFKQLAQSWLPASYDNAESTYKVGHFLFFFFITLLFMLNSQSLPITKAHVLVLMIILAVATEGMQLHLFNRSTRLFDIAIDCSGILLAWMLVVIYNFAKEK